MNGRKVMAPALMVPGHAEGTVTVHLGFGRGVEAGRAGAGVGLQLLSAAHVRYAIRYGGHGQQGRGYYDLCVTKVNSLSIAARSRSRT